MHDLHLLNNERSTRATFLGLSDMSPAATTILAIKDCSDSPGVSYTRLLMCPHKKKSRGVKSGDLGGQGTGPPRPIHLLEYLSFITWRTAIEKWAGALSCWYHILRRILRGTSSNSWGRVRSRKALSFRLSGNRGKYVVQLRDHLKYLPKHSRYIGVGSHVLLLHAGFLLSTDEDYAD